MLIAKKKRAILKKATPYAEEQKQPIFGGHDHDHESQNRTSEFNF